MATHPTTDERLIANVFESLADSGILAKPNHWCCSTCASTDLHGQVQGDDRFGGYAWYHEQDDDSVREGGALYIGFAYKGEEDDSRAQTAAIGHTISDALKAAGLTVVWEGDPGVRIRVDDLYFEPHTTCDGCYEREEDCQCCWSCDSYPCECEDECDGCGEPESDCCCDEDEDDEDDD